jgi:hypothetical protein
LSETLGAEAVETVSPAEASTVLITVSVLVVARASVIVSVEFPAPIVTVRCEMAW